MLRSIGNVEAARARAEAFFSSPANVGGVDEIALQRKASEDAIREKTNKLREARLAREAMEKASAPLRAGRRRA